MQTDRIGVLWAIGSYFIWGLMPLYWKTLEHVNSGEILASRIVWAFVWTLLFVFLIKGVPHLKADLRTLWTTKKDFWGLVLASFVVSSNWFLYIWMVNHDVIIQTSLGYYMNPLLSVLLGIVFFKERLSIAQQIAFLLATIGVLIMTFSYGQFPWLAFLLALTFSIYGVMKKKIQLDALRGLTIETFFIVPIAVGYYIWLFIQQEAAFLHIHMQTDLLLILTGAATALPLVMYAKGVQRIPLYVAGFLQYIAPTMMLIIGIVVYGESFGGVEFLSFSFIWLALILFTVSKVVEAMRGKKLQAKHIGMKSR